ncbi:MAG: spermidine/putrescine ABC transporter substrate-binding protein [Anaerolineales bacterium]|uniref:ABC transporter substrate-binding protein n=1 Tax=Candidatus Villigracilis proximus TaxID=3140683 RepID=UPI003134F13D|nr:spermidine/putrescine ABC transporter substrate-binding protein [Anaerolineales bacterium]
MDPPQQPRSEADGPKVTSTGFACPAAEFPMEVTSTEVNIFVWTEYIPVEMLECFELVYGVKVNRDEYSSNEEMYAKVSAGGSNYDLVQPTDYIIALMARQDLLQELDHAKLPVLKNFDANYLDFEFDPGNKYTIPYQAGTDAIVVNTDAVENVPASWEDLWKPEYAGNMVFLDDSRATIGLTLLTLGYDVNTTDPAQLDEAKTKLAQLVPGIKLFDSDSPKTALIAGDVDLGMTWTAEALLAQQENPAIQYVYPTEGAILWQDNWAMLKDAPHADAAYALLNYTMQGDVFWLMLRDFPYTNPNQAALDYAKTNQTELYDAYMASPITNVPADAIKNGHRIADVGEATPLYDDIWVEVKGQ